MNLRVELEVCPDSPLKPFDLVFDNVCVLATRKEVAEFVDASLCRRLFGAHRRAWSGMTIPVDGLFVIVMNETHAPTRQNATLMEEFFHILLGHRPSKINICEKTGLMRREYDKQTENEAYYAAAAALVPYRVLKRMASNGDAVSDIARHFEVSSELVSFRLKTCKLYRRALRN